MLKPLLLFIHLLSAMAWIGGMFFAYFCLRPAAAEVLAPPSRLPLWAATFARFLPYMGVAVSLILATGLAMLLSVGFHAAPIGWHIMFGIGLAMALIFVFLYVRLFPVFRARCAVSDWPAAAEVLNRIRQLVALNLVLGIVVIFSAVFGR